MRQPLTVEQYRQGVNAQHAALRDLHAHAERVLAGLPWMNDQTAEVYAVLRNAAKAAEVESLLLP